MRSRPSRITAENAMAAIASTPRGDFLIATHMPIDTRAMRTVAINGENDRMRSRTAGSRSRGSRASSSWRWMGAGPIAGSATFSIVSSATHAAVSWFDTMYGMAEEPVHSVPVFGLHETGTATGADFASRYGQGTS